MIALLASPKIAPRHVVTALAIVAVIATLAVIVILLAPKPVYSCPSGYQIKIESDPANTTCVRYEP